MSPPAGPCVRCCAEEHIASQDEALGLAAGGDVSSACPGTKSTRSTSPSSSTSRLPPGTLGAGEGQCTPNIAAERVRPPGRHRTMQLGTQPVAPPGPGTAHHMVGMACVSTRRTVPVFCEEVFQLPAPPPRRRIPGPPGWPGDHCAPHQVFSWNGLKVKVRCGTWSEKPEIRRNKAAERGPKVVNPQCSAPPFALPCRAVDGGRAVPGAKAQFYPGHPAGVRQEPGAVPGLPLAVLPLRPVGDLLHKGGRDLAQYVSMSGHRHFEGTGATAGLHHGRAGAVHRLQPAHRLPPDNIGLTNDDQYNIGGVNRTWVGNHVCSMKAIIPLLDRQVRRPGPGDAGPDDVRRQWKDVLRNSTLLNIPAWFDKGCGPTWPVHGAPPRAATSATGAQRQVRGSTG